MFSVGSISVLSVDFSLADNCGQNTRESSLLAKPKRSDMDKSVPVSVWVRLPVMDAASQYIIGLNMLILDRRHRTLDISPVPRDKINLILATKVKLGESCTKNNFLGNLHILQPINGKHTFSKKIRFVYKN